MFLSIEELKAQTPSQRAQFALDALEEMEASEGWGVEMSHYHTYSHDKCFACLGGAAAIKAIKGEFGEQINLSGQRCFLEKFLETPKQINFFTKFEDSLNFLRYGDVDAYFASMGLSASEGRPYNVYISNYGYREDPEGFKSEMKKLIKTLQEAGY